MRIRKIWSVAVVSAIALAFAGCRDTSGSTSPGKNGGAEPTTDSDLADADDGSLEKDKGFVLELDEDDAGDDRTPDKMPEVRLSEQHLESCLLKQGDMMPDVTLKDVDGAEQQLSTLLGGKLTVVCFWTSRLAAALQQLADIGPDVADKYRESGVNVIGINHRESAELVKAALEMAGANFPNLLDEESAVFDQVATEHLPRTYLLDATGKILWFDLEYSSETQRHLDEAIRFALAHAEERPGLEESESPEPKVSQVPGAEDASASPETESPAKESPETESPEAESPETESPETESPETESPEAPEAP